MLTFPHADQYTAAPLGIYPPALQGLLARVETPALLEAHLKAFQAQAQAAPKRRTKTAKPKGEPARFALVDITGPVSKFGSSLSPALPLIELRRQVRQAAEDASIEGLIIRVDSPGGSLAGTDDLALEIATTAKRKPVTAFLEDMTASAAYWIASQASRIVATPSTLVGSIGVYHVLHDFSEADRQRGIRTIVIKSGAAKGIAARGAPVTKEEEAEIQRVVDATGDLFIERIASGRKLSLQQARALADGRVHLATEAKRLRLIDHVGSLDDVIEDLRRRVSPGGTSEPVVPVAARSEPLSLEDAEDAWQTMLRAHGGDADAAKRNHVDLYARILEARRAARGARSSNLN